MPRLITAWFEDKGEFHASPTEAPDMFKIRERCDYYTNTARLIEQIEGSRRASKSDPYPEKADIINSWADVGYNQAIQDVINIIGGGDDKS